jgi:hypothetical protein
LPQLIFAQRLFQMQTLVQYDIGMTQAKKPVLFKDRLSSQWVLWNSLSVSCVEA